MDRFFFLLFSSPPAPSTSQIDTEIRHHIDTGKPWSGPLDKSIRQSFVENLRSKCHSWATLKNTGYRMDPTQKGYQHAPQGGPQKRAAVALDCEMVQTENGQECVQLCAVDMITGEAIVDVGVFPLARVTNWVTRYSGMSWKRLKAMEKKGKTVHGWPSARERLFKYINRDTVLVGHALENDLKTLGIVHDNIVDTSILTKEVVEEHIGVCGRKWALRKLTAAFVGIAIQNSSSGHDCMEDTMATREVLLVCLLKPDVLEQWAVEAAVEEGRVGNGPAYGGVEDFM
ncbi:hypothetical protein P170DRAFT_479098 [Aspergillus steynii IBT 23096]|uniref:Exonuclease domain-containing protein n=1 Tax=Aspergillus steynii IBT 23096 TaxID=1392250 RepID=A0A2I2FZW8_9EURO|nr:uncharacterized protein P170DRAFT_479098 [Aspergillus steynii IBT 23096]PLB46177.1 hypothetical protein P170DRAFT_479098 [Aspergillus steynii IBT 23096]